VASVRLGAGRLCAGAMALGAVTVVGLVLAAGASAVTFAPKSDFATGASPFSVAVGDFNADGDPDLVTANAGSSNVSVLLGVPGGGFAPKTDVGAGGGAHGVAVGDFNADGDPDLAVANLSADTVSVLLGQPGGGFAPKTDFATGSQPRSVAVGDFNADGDPDLVTTNNGAATVSVLLGLPGGGFAPKTDFAAGGQPFAVAIGDFNADGDPDLAVANFASNSVSVLLGLPGGGFAPKTDFAAGQNPPSLAVGDFDIDGDPDLAVTNVGGISVLLNTTDVAPPETTIDSGPSGPTNDNTPTFTFSSSDAGSTFECRVDSDEFASCTTPHTTGTLLDGPHTFEVRATDPAGNTDATPASRSFTVDAVAPQTSITSGPSGQFQPGPLDLNRPPGPLTNDSTPTFTFTSSEAASTFECRVDAGPFQACSSPLTTAHLADGQHTFAVRATDAVGNTDPTPASVSFTVAPQCTLVGITINLGGSPLLICLFEVRAATVHPARTPRVVSVTATLVRGGRTFATGNARGSSRLTLRPIRRVTAGVYTVKVTARTASGRRLTGRSAMRITRALARRLNK